MRPTRIYLVIAILGVGLLGAFWAAHAQEGGPMWAPPAVLPTNEAAPAKKPFGPKYAPKSSPKKAKADPTLIVPAEVYDIPRPIQSENAPSEVRKGFVTEEAQDVVQTGGVVPPPLFPPAPKQEKDLNVPPPLPAMDTKPLVVPMLEPTKALIADLPLEVVPKKAVTPEATIALPMPPMVIPRPVVLPEIKADPVTPPPAVVPPEIKKVPVTPPPVVVPPEIKKDPVLPPPAVVLPGPAVAEEPKQIPPPSAVTIAEPRQVPKSRAFVRIESAANNTPPTALQPAPVLPPRLVPSEIVVPPPTPSAIGLSGPLSLQTPSVSVQKRGPGTINAGESGFYQIVIRNLGPVPAQQVHIEDDLPANVRIASAEPMPQLQGNKAVWVLSTMNINQEQTIRLTLSASANVEVNGRISAQVVSATTTSTTAYRPPNDLARLAIQLTGPRQVVAGKPVVFEIRVTNQSSQPLTGIVLHGLLPEGLNTPDGRAIEGAVDATIAPGETKTLKMPANAEKPGRWTVTVKVTANGGLEASATTNIDVAGETLFLQQAPATRLFMGRSGDLRVEVTNHTAKSMRNVVVKNLLPEGLDFVDASERGLYQANSRTVHWLIDHLPAGKSQVLIVRVQGTKAGQHQNVVTAKADGVAELRSSSVVALEGVSDLTLRVVDKDYLVELGKENVYEIRVQNPGNASASNVKLQVQFPPGLTPKSASGNSKYTMDRQTVVFEPISSLAPQGQVIFRVSALAHGMGDQRVRFAVVSEQVRTPIQREISTMVVER